MFELTSNYFRWTCLTFPATFVAKIQRLYHSQSCHYDVIIPQDLNLRNQTVRRGANIGLGTRLPGWPPGPEAFRCRCSNNMYKERNLRFNCIPKHDGSCAHIYIMEYGSTPYIGIALKKNGCYIACVQSDMLKPLPQM